MDIMEWIKLGTALASAIAAALAWAAKLWWGREFAAAKDETIKAKDAQAAAKDEIIKAKDAQIETLNREVDSLRELTPMKIREYFLSVRDQLEEYNDHLEEQLAEARDELAKKDARISKLKNEGAKKADEIQRLESERQQIAEAAASLEEQLQTLRKKHQGEDAVVCRLPRFDTQLLKRIDFYYHRLGEALAKDIADVSDLSESLLRFSALDEDLCQSILSMYLMNVDRSQTSQSAEDSDNIESDGDAGEDEIEDEGGDA